VHWCLKDDCEPIRRPSRLIIDRRTGFMPGVVDHVTHSVFYNEPATVGIARVVAPRAAVFCTVRPMTFDHIDLERVLRLHRFFKMQCGPGQYRNFIRASPKEVGRRAMHVEYECLQDLYLYRPELLLANKLPPTCLPVIIRICDTTKIHIAYMLPPNPRSVSSDAHGRPWCETCERHAIRGEYHAGCYFE